MAAPSGKDGARRRGARSSKHSSSQARARKKPSPAASDLAALRDALLGAERARITELERKPGLRELEPEDVSRVLPEAVELRSAEGQGLRSAMRPSVEGAIGHSVERDPEVLADALSPMIGLTLRKAAAAAFGRATRGPLRAWPAVVLAVLLVAVFGVRKALSGTDEEARWRDAARRLQIEPGFVLVGIDEVDDVRVFRGLRDPLARRASVVVEKSGIDVKRARFEWQPYHSLETEFALERARALLDPPETVALKLREGVLVAEGQAAAEWIRRASQLSSSVVGVQALDASALLDVDLEECRRLVHHLDGRKVKFAKHSAELDLELASISGVETALVRLDQAASRAGLRVVVELRPEILPPERGAGLGPLRTRIVKQRLDAIPRSTTLVRTDDQEQIVGYLNGGPEGKLPRVLLKVELVGLDER